MEGYREITFHVLEEDYHRGLTVMLLDVGGPQREKLVPFAWITDGQDDRPSTYTNSDDTTVVDYEVYGGTKEQFDHQKGRLERLLAKGGKTLGVYAHFPKKNEPGRCRTCGRHVTSTNPPKPCCTPR